MVERLEELNNVFGSLSDPTRRDILKRIAKQAMSVSEIAHNYDLTFAAISKHLGVLEQAQLIKKERRGKEQIVSLVPYTLSSAQSYIENFSTLWETRLDSLDTYLNSINKNNKKK